MNKQVSPLKNGKLVVIGIILALVAGLFAAKMVVENKIEARLMADLRLYEPHLHLESAEVEASFLSSSVSFKNIVYSIAELPGLTLSIEKATQEGIDRDTLTGKPGLSSSFKKLALHNMRVAVDALEEPLMEIGYYEVTDMVYPYRAMRAALHEAKDSQDFLAIFKKLAPELQSAKIESGPSLMRDFKMQMGQLGMFDMYLREVTASGFKSLDKESSGYDGLMENAQYKDLKIGVEPIKGLEIIAALDFMEVKNLKYNYKEIFDVLAKFDPTTDIVELLSETTPAFSNYSFEAIDLRGFSLSAAGGVFTMESAHFGPHSMAEQGPNRASNMRLQMNDSEVFSLEAVGLDKVVLSDMMLLFVSNPNSIINNRQLEDQIAADPLSVMEGFRLENLYIKNLNAPGLLSLDEWNCSSAFGEGKISLSSRLDKLSMSQQGVRQIGDFMTYLDDSLYDIFAFMAMNPEGISLDGAFDLLASREPEKVDYELKLDLAEKTGALFFGVKGEVVLSLAYEHYGYPMFSLVQLHLTDSGFLDNAFDYFAQQGGAPSGAEARNMIVQELDEAMPRLKPSDVALVRGVRGFLSQGGSLRLEITPKRPMRLEDADIFDGTDDLNIVVEHVK